MKCSFVGKTLFILTIVSCVGIVRADEDDYSFGEFAFDVGTGMAISACEKDPACSEALPMMTIIALVVGGVIACCFPNENPEPIRPKKVAKRIGGTSLGYAIGRTFF